MLAGACSTSRSPPEPVSEKTGTVAATLVVAPEVDAATGAPDGAPGDIAADGGYAVKWLDAWGPPAIDSGPRGPDITIDVDADRPAGPDGSVWILGGQPPRPPPQIDAGAECRPLPAYDATCKEIVARTSGASAPVHATFCPRGRMFASSCTPYPAWLGAYPGAIACCP